MHHSSFLPQKEINTFDILLQQLIGEVTFSIKMRKVFKDVLFIKKSHQEFVRHNTQAAQFHSAMRNSGKDFRPF